MTTSTSTTSTYTTPTYWAKFTTSINAASASFQHMRRTFPSPKLLNVTRHCHLHAPLIHPMYVIAMGWNRWGITARRKWARKLRAACVETIANIDEWLWTEAAFDEDHRPDREN